MMIDDTSPVFISSEVAASVFDWRAAISALQAAYAKPLPASAAPARSIAASGGSWLRCLPAAPPDGRYFGAKLMGLAGEAGRPAVQYVIVLYDRETSRIAALVDGDKVTGFRTAATSAAALDRLCPARVGKLAVLGSGLEAAMHSRAFAAIRQFSEIALFSPTPAKRERLANELQSELGVSVRPAESAEQAVAGSDVVLAAARSYGEKPILFGEWIESGTVTVSIGSTVPQQREIDVSVVAQSDLIICDMVHEVVAETGDMIAARNAGVVFEERCHPIEALMDGRLSDRVAQARFPLFKSVGGGMQDVIVASLILMRALEEGLETRLPMSFASKYV